MLHMKFAVLIYLTYPFGRTDCMVCLARKSCPRLALTDCIKERSLERDRNSYIDNVAEIWVS